MKKKILLASKCQNDTTSFLRAMGAFSHPTLKPHVEIMREPKDQTWVFDWSYYWEADLIYLHRPSNMHDRQIIDQAKQMGVPVWVDLDDDLENVTPDNPVYDVYKPESSKEIIRFACTEADVLSCGGEVHAEKLRKELGREVHLIPNALDDRLLNLKKPFSMNRKLSWRGSESHRIDLLYYQEPIGKILDRYKLDARFFGWNPYFLDWDETRKIQWTATTNLFDFYIALTSTNASFHMHPMVDTWFNRVKSNLCFTDATLAGSVICAPNFPEYGRPGIIHFEANDKADFYRAMELMVNLSEGELTHCHNVAWEWIKDNILMSRVNLIRLNILNNL